MRQVTKNVTAATEEATAALSTAREALQFQRQLHDQAIELLLRIATCTDSVAILRDLVRIKQLLRSDEIESVEQALEVIQREATNYRHNAQAMYSASLKQK